MTRGLVFEDPKSTCVHINAGGADVDDELLGWLADAATLVSQPRTKAERPSRRSAPR